MTSKLKLYLIAASVTLGSISSQAAPICSDLFNRKLIIADKAVDPELLKLQLLRRQNKVVLSWEKYNSNEVTPHEALTLDVLKKLSTNPRNDHAGISYPEALKILRDTDLPLYGEILTEVTQKLKADADITLEDFGAALKETLLSRHYTIDLINTRLAALKSNEKPNWKSILGDLSLNEVHEMFYGNNVLKPTPNSLLGQYLAATGAQTRILQLEAEHGSQAGVGTKKLVVSVSAESFEQFKSIVLSSKHFMTVVGHAAVIHNGSFYSHSGDKSDIRATREGTPFPMLLVKTSEAQRLTRYMELAVDPKYTNWYAQNALKKPWYLEKYCARGAYECCTHWLGNIPIGDKRVKEYSFPGDNYGTKTNAQPLVQYEITEQNKDLANVWKSPGHQQLSNLIGQKKANNAGEMASPGYVIQTLLGPTKSERVPIVFVMTLDHKAAIPDKPVFSYENPR